MQNSHTETDRLSLVFPTLEYTDEILSYRAEFLAHGENMAGTSGLRFAESVEEWIDELVEQRAGAVGDLVQATTFLTVRVADQRVVGMVNIRHRLNDYLRVYGGHIGYSIRRSERGKGYGKRQLSLALAECRRLGLRKVMITCDRSNAASRDVILANGGVFTRESIVDEQPTQIYWIYLDLNGAGGSGDVVDKDSQDH